MLNRDQKEFEELWRASESRVAAFLLREGSSHQEIPDLLQETAERAWQNRHKRRDKSERGFFPWACGIARRVRLAGFRKSGRLSFSNELEIENGSRSPVRKDTLILITQILKKLVPIERKVVSLHDLHGMNFEKIGEVLDISSSNAHYHYRKAIETLREQFPELMGRNGVSVVK